MSWLLAILRVIPSLLEAATKLAETIRANRAQRERAAKDARNEAAIREALKSKEPAP